ncbi:hypothetical protein NDI76_06095 [Halogeometricum sp. S1BR25-6]|uniref:DUF7322 domain-containing protein n=1 Tax=Halogeometricum salsisoli TaxID=2950536 RepID=A0ABU2GBX7_9EURY|nr:hypothetical protein [Halogeometricum sp. S1BR25-6]MDS0298307.1 hypothetical protein [Halogeometricum sp. S1BR25-6]
MRDDRDIGLDDVYPDEYRGPTARIPNVDVPKVDVPTANSDSMSDSSITTLFVLQVVIWNAVLLCFSLGLMLIYFRQNGAAGGQLLSVSLILALYGVYRWPRSGDDSDENGDDDRDDNGG